MHNYLFALLFAGCTSTTATFTTSDHAESGSAGAQNGGSSPIATKTTGSAVTETGGTSSATTEGRGGARTVRLGAAAPAGGTSESGSTTEEGGSVDAAGATSEDAGAAGAAGAAGQSSNTDAAGAAGSSGVAGASGSAGAPFDPLYFSTIDNQHHPLTDDPMSVYEYDQFIGFGCGTVWSRPYELCEPYEKPEDGSPWKWRAKRFPGNPLLTACQSLGDAACAKFNSQQLCGNEVRDDGTCGPTPHFEPQCAGKDNIGPMICWRFCLSCTVIDGVSTPPYVCPAAQTAITTRTDGLTCGASSN